ncbi:MAG: type VI secretion system baseplate subunit TssF [Phycisphaerales bacterium]|nr:type VI secretion system baseplate subunit TssF [Phycisphaerales bacterium]MCI0629485.1 type VI secretion system baseplate subunit TssF [Phycisphaerales bacterium]MCI0674745.1 type VI secretion system baseplate subunit TssF [Phycisphaerales bacterium]
MTDELLPYYQRELSYLRRLGAEFADAHPDDAARLRISADTCDDPHVERMIEAFAYLTARIRHKLDDDFPEITSALLSVLYPHYLAPIPSMAIVELVLDRGQGGLTKGLRLARETVIETEPVDGEPCRFRTCYPVTLWPIELVSARLGAAPFSEGKPPPAPGVSTVLRLELKCYAKDMTFSKLEMPALRFFLKGQPQHVQALHELIFNSTLEVSIGSGGAAPRMMGTQCLQQVGFNLDEGMLPYPARSFPGYRMLTEYFAFPEKFLFFELAGLSPSLLNGIGNKLEVCLYLNRSSADLEHNVSADMFRLGCTPVVNLFQQRAEPIRLTQTDTEYHIVPDARRPLATEVYSVEKVTATAPSGEAVEYVPFYSFKHAIDRHKQQTFWYAARKPAESRERRTDEGTEAYLSFVDLDFNPAAAPNWTIDVQTTCLNRDLPHRLPFGGGQPRLQLATGGPISRLTCLTPPTPTLRAAHRHQAMWRIISHLSLNHLSIADENGSPDALREILKLYDYASTASTQSKIAAILDVRSRRVVGRAGGAAAGGFCRGIEVAVLFDEDRFTDNGLFLFASVIERFLGLYCSVNSFSRLVARTKQRQGAYRQWSPRAAEKALL